MYHKLYTCTKIKRYDPGWTTLRGRIKHNSKKRDEAWDYHSLDAIPYYSMSLNMRRWFSIKSHLNCVLVITRNVTAPGISLLNWIELDRGEVPISRILKASRNKGGMSSVDWEGLVSKKKRTGWQWEEDERKPEEVPSPSRGDLGRVRIKEVCNQWTEEGWAGQ